MILAANFKMNHTRSSTRDYIGRLKEFLTSQGGGFPLQLYLFPPSTALDNYGIQGLPLEIGVQNGYPAVRGSFTGEIGLEQMEEFGIGTILIGHSERRHLLGESQEFIAEKFSFYRDHGFTIFYCIGETAEVRQSGSRQLIEAYLREQLDGIDLSYPHLVIAYEPVWAIGTGVTAREEDIAEALGYLRGLTEAPLLYGGSVKPENIGAIVALHECSGALVGTASWDVENFIRMIEIVKES
ncbi:MAG: triose-phosphate isomerase [Epsilonproteobacteria bacterium]|nr:triose-phosphate isomerase [Campylobacterota bacterium]NPA56818.1 triose-phosphate isomerase [Campylobacterota bacterium]